MVIDLRKKLLNAIVAVFYEVLTDGIIYGENAAETILVIIALCFAVPVLLIIAALGTVYGFVNKLLHPKEILDKAMT